MAHKKRILLNWWYDRKDLMQPFLDLADDFEFVCVFYKKPSQREDGLPFPVVFWGDFTTPYQLLDQVKPDEVVFFNIDDAPYQVALSIASRLKGITTTICDHGLRGFIELPPPRFVYDSKKLQSFWFLMSSVRLKNRHLLPKVIKLAMLKLRGRSGTGPKPDLRELRIADRYLCYSAENASFFIQRDRISPKRVTLIGNPSCDPFFQDQEFGPAAENYYLLIDQPLSRGKFNSALITDEQKANFLEKLNHFAITRHHRLYIKLHPDEYDLPELYSDPNVRYVRQQSMGRLIGQSKGVFGFYSTLLLPAIYSKKCVLFRLTFVPLQQLWADLGVVKLLDFFSFYLEDLDFDYFEVPEIARKQLADRFLYKTDGRSLERLRQALLA